MDPNAPSVSVIIPTWNRAHCIRNAIASVLVQQPPPLEVLICDDGSSDDTRAVVEAMGDERVRFLPGPHTGRPAIARNLGIAQSRGEWLAFLDSDDEWLPGKLAAQLALMRVLSCRAACTNALRVLPGLGAQGNLLDFALPRLSFQHLLRGNVVVCSSVLLDRSLLVRVGGFPEQAGVVAAEDYPLWLKLATYTDFAFVAAPLVVYSDNPAASIRGVDPRSDRRRTRAVFADYLRWAGPLSYKALRLRAEIVRRTVDEQKERWAKRRVVSRP